MPVKKRRRSSDTSWEDAAKTAVETAEESLRDLRVAEIKKIDVTIKDARLNPTGQGSMDHSNIIPL